jgi:predicted lipoprotein with Yx(FWY)xxD motif
MHRVLTLAAIAATLIVAGCGGSNSNSNSNSGETPASAAMSDTVGVKQIDGIGKVLVDTSGMALYTPDQEAKGMIQCTGSCTGDLAAGRSCRQADRGCRRGDGRRRQTPRRESTGHP